MADIIKYPKAGSSDTALAVDTSGNATIGGTITNAAQLVTISGSTGTLTPTSSVVVLTTDATLALTLANPSAAGQRLTIIQAADFATTVADNANVKQYGGSGAATILNQYDAAEYVASSTSLWIEVTESANN
jgi:hypothetical protein